MLLAYDNDDANLPKVEVIDGVEWPLAYCTTTLFSGLFYAWKDPLDRWHLWHPAQGAKVFMVEAEGMVSVTPA